MSKATKDSKDLIIDNLKKQVDEYKKRLESQNYDSLTARITELESQLEEKTQECEDLKATANMSGESGSSTELKTKMILLQSKIRASEGKFEEVTKQKEELEQKVKRMEGKAGDSDQINVLKSQLKQEMERSEKLRTQLNQMQGSSPQAQEEINNLRKQLQAAQNAQKSGGPMVGNAGDINKLRADLSARDQRIAELEKQMSSGSANLTGPMANVRLQREINALKSQIDMMKKNEAEIKKKYEEAVRKSESKSEDEW